MAVGLPGSGRGGRRRAVPRGRSLRRTRASRRAGRGGSCPAGARQGVGPLSAPWGTPGRALRAYYFCYFAAIGVIEPYLNLYFLRRGFSSAEIGLLASIPHAVQGLFPFVWTALSDIRGSRGRIFRWNAWATCGAYALLFLPVGLWPLAGLLAAYAIVKSPLIPLANAIAFTQGRREEFGRIRVWGTLGYIAAAVLLGPTIDAVGLSAVLYGGGLALLGGGLVAQGGFADGGGGLGGRFRREFAALMRNGNFLRFLGVAFIARVAGGPFIVFFTIHLQGLGISKAWAGLAWGLGATLEVLVMLAWAPLLGRFGTRALLATGLGLGVVRWVGFAFASQVWSILAIQLLHGLVFGTTYLASIHFLDTAVPAALRATGQGLYAAVTFGLGGIVGNVASGALVDRVGMSRLYLGAALLALAAWGLFLGGVRTAEPAAAEIRTAAMAATRAETRRGR